MEINYQGRAEDLNALLLPAREKGGFVSNALSYLLTSPNLRRDINDKRRTLHNIADELLALPPSTEFSISVTESMQIKLPMSIIREGRVSSEGIRTLQESVAHGYYAALSELGFDPCDHKDLMALKFTANPNNYHIHSSNPFKDGREFEGFLRGVDIRLSIDRGGGPGSTVRHYEGRYSTLGKSAQTVVISATEAKQLWDNICAARTMIHFMRDDSHCELCIIDALMNFHKNLPSEPPPPIRQIFKLK